MRNVGRKILATARGALAGGGPVGVDLCTIVSAVEGIFLCFTETFDAFFIIHINTHVPDQLNFLCPGRVGSCGVLRVL